MKLLKKIRLINWFFYVDETIEIGKQTLITGKTGAGKSTIVDALQVLFLVNLHSIRFNVAAHEEAKRTLINYLKGKIGRDKQAFVRNEAFSTYIVAEFYDTDTRESFVIGVIFDVSSDDSYDEQRFILSDKKLRDIEFVTATGYLKTREQFQNDYNMKDRTTNFERNKTSFQQALLRRLGHLNNRFFRVFAKGIAFKPISNVRDFVNDYILEDKDLQIEAMKSNFDAYEKYRLDLDHLINREQKLLEIEQQFTDYKKMFEIVKGQEYSVLRYEVLLSEQEKIQWEAQVEHFTKEIEKREAQKLAVVEKLLELANQSEEAYSRWQNNNEEKRKKELNETINNLLNQFEELVQSVNQYKQLIKVMITNVTHMESFKQIVKPLQTYDLNGYLQVLNTINAKLQLDKKFDNHFINQVSQDLRNCFEIISSLNNEIVKSIGLFEERIKQNRLSQQQLEEEIKKLKQNRFPYPPSVEKLRLLLQEKLSNHTQIYVFCETLDLVNDKWRNAVEGYLNNQRFDLIVPPNDFAEALAIYEHYKSMHKLEGVGIIDTQKQAMHTKPPQSNSLATIIKTENEFAQIHVNYLLGNVMLAANERELRNYRTAITETCMVYHRFVARQMKEERYKIPYIGAKALVQQLEMKEQELVDLKKVYQQLKDQLHFTEQAHEILRNSNKVERITQHLTCLNNLIECQEKLDGLQDELNNLDLSHSNLLKANYEAIKTEIKALEKTRDKVVSEIESDKSRNKEALHKLQESMDKCKLTIEKVETWENENRLTHLQEARDRFIRNHKDSQDVYTTLQNMKISRQGNETKLANLFATLKALRMDYNIQYQQQGQVDDEDNNFYDNLRIELNEIDLPSYKRKIAEVIEKTEEQFQSQFIFKLRDAILMAKNEFDHLNYSLKKLPHTTENYRFDVKTNKKYEHYYEAITNNYLIEKDTLFGDEENSQTSVLKELFEKIVQATESEQKELIDYREYLDFEFTITFNDGSKKHLSEVLKEQSGGETQTPFYIAILASFYHLYNDKGAMRLVVFDEAFNKMDEERIEMSLKLIKDLNLQLIAAVPDEKMGNMMPHVSTTLLVTREDTTCYVDFFEQNMWENDIELIEQVEQDSEQETLF